MIVTNGSKKEYETSLCIPGIDQLKVVSNLEETDTCHQRNWAYLTENYQSVTTDTQSFHCFRRCGILIFIFPRLGTKAVTSVLGEWIRKKSKWQ